MPRLSRKKSTADYVSDILHSALDKKTKTSKKRAAVKTIGAATVIGVAGAAVNELVKRNKTP